MIGILKHEGETIFAVLMVTAITVFFLAKYKNPEQHIFVPTLPTFLTTPTPTQSPLPTSQTFTSLSPDGTKTLFVKKQSTSTTTTYTVFVSDNSQKTQKTIYTTTIDSTQAFSIPFNTWSPDDMYVFLKKESPSGNEYYVLSLDDNTSGPITIQDRFTKAYPDLVLTDVTGWAAPYLLIVNTKTKTGELGPSFWFDITTNSFIELANRFN